MFQSQNSGLIQYQHFWVHSKHRGNGNALFLTGAEMIWNPAGIIRHTHSLQGGMNTLIDLTGRKALIDRAESYILIYTGRKKLIIRILKNQTD